jgi:hypothetical protein
VVGVSPLRRLADISTRAIDKAAQGGRVREPEGLASSSRSLTSAKAFQAELTPDQAAIVANGQRLPSRAAAPLGIRAIEVEPITTKRQ